MINSAPLLAQGYWLDAEKVASALLTRSLARERGLRRLLGPSRMVETSGDVTEIVYIAGIPRPTGTSAFKLTTDIAMCCGTIWII